MAVKALWLHMRRVKRTRIHLLGLVVLLACAVVWRFSDNVGDLATTATGAVGIDASIDLGRRSLGLFAWQPAAAHSEADAAVALASLAPLVPGRAVRLGILTTEVWSYEVDHRLGGFGFAALMVSKVITGNPSLNATGYLLHTERRPRELAHLKTLHGCEIIFRDDPAEDARTHGADANDDRTTAASYASRLRSLNLDLIITIEFRRPYVDVLKHVMDVPVVVWVHDPHTPAILRKIRELHVPTAKGFVYPTQLSPPSYILRESLRHHRRVHFAVTAEYFRGYYQEAYNISLPESYTPTLLPYPMDAIEEGRDGVEDVNGATEAHSSAAEWPSGKHPTPRVIAIGRLDPVKRPWLVVEVARAMPDVEFVMLGRLYTNNPLGFNFSDATAIPPNVRLFGHVEGDEKRALIESSWMLLSTAIHEGLPFNYVEALQRGLPIVSTHNAEHIAERFGIYVGNFPKDSGFEAVPYLVQAIRHLVANERLRRELGEAGRAWVAQTMNTAAFAGALRGLLEQAQRPERFPAIANWRPRRDNQRVAICTTMKNEDDAIVEWVEFHRMVGVNHIFIYHADDHDDHNRWRSLLWPFVSAGVVTVEPVEFSYLGQQANRQAASLQACLAKRAADFDWIGFIDMDEFLVPADPTRTLPELLAGYRSAPGLVLPWRTFGPAPTEEPFPPITRATLAMPFDLRTGLFGRFSATLKVIVNTAHPLGTSQCHFLQSGGLVKAERFVHYCHNCLYNSPEPAVDVLQRPVTVAWNLGHGASSAVLQLNHYFARSCAHYRAKIQMRLAWYRARYGHVVLPWFQSRVGIGLGDSDEEVCRNLRQHFNTTDLSVAPYANLLQEAVQARHQQIERLEKATSGAGTGSVIRETPLPARPSCDRCHMMAACVDTLQGAAACTCTTGFVGNGTFCGVPRWVQTVLSPPQQGTGAWANLSHLVGAPDGNVYHARFAAGSPLMTPTMAPESDDAATTTELIVSFADGANAVVPEVGLIYLYQPFRAGAIASIAAASSAISALAGEWTELWSRDDGGHALWQPDVLDQVWQAVPIPRTDIRMLRIRFRAALRHPLLPVLGGIAIIETPTAAVLEAAAGSVEDTTGADT